MTTKVITTVICPNVHRAKVTVQDKHADGFWHDADSRMVELGQTVCHEGYITDTRRVVIEEVPEPKPAQ